MTEIMKIYKSVLLALMGAAFVTGQGAGQTPECSSDADCPGSQVCCLGALVGGGGVCIDQSNCVNG